MTLFPRALLPGLAAVLVAGVPQVASASKITVLYQFTGRLDGGSPSGPLLLDAGGNLYGTTLISGAHNNGVVFQLTPGANGAPWTETVLYSFPALKDSVDIFANGGLIEDANGALYGNAFENELGFAYRLSPPAQGGPSWRYKTLYSFTGLADGGGPSGPLSWTPAGDLAGVTQAGGNVTGRNPCDCGVGFVLAPGGNGGSWNESVAHGFTGRPDGNTPSGALAVDADGALYGTTNQGGSGKCVDHIAREVVGCGTVFRLSQSGGNWAETILYNFQPHTGDYPVNSVVFGPDGALYGSVGTEVFRLAEDKQGNWQETVLHRFPHGMASSAPDGGLIFDPSGNIYGVTDSTGLYGHATAFELSPPSGGGQTWTKKTLAIFATNVNGPQPYGGLVRGPDGTFYGAIGSAPGGSYGYIFAIKP